ncbi:acyl-CoA dehydrogenase family protein [soil metagenome]
MSDPTAATGAPFAWTEEHVEFRGFLRKKLESLSPRASARASLEDPASGVDDATWRELADEIGLTGLTLPEEYGGSGFGRVEQALAGEELGRALVGGPYLSTVVLAAQAILHSGDDASMAAHLPGIAAGRTLAALAVAEGGTAWDVAATTATVTDGVLTGTKDAVVGAAGADLLVVSARDGEQVSLFLVDPADDTVTVIALEALDATRPLARVRFDGTPGVRLGEPGAAPAVLDAVREGAAIHLAAEQAGGSRACVDLTARHARERVQFGVPIGRFQGVKHRLADMEVRTAQAHAAAVWAAWQRPGTAEASLGASVARSWCSESFVQTAFDMVQLFGGIAITWEHDAHLYLRRAQADAVLLGSAADDRRRLENFIDPERSTR